MNATTDDSQKDWATGQIERFAEVRPGYVEFADVLKRVLEKAAAKEAPLAIVQTRPKALASFAEKIQRKCDEYDDPVNQFTDLCGGRVITLVRRHVLAMCDFIKAHFEIDWENSVDVIERLKPAEFGYRSIHYIVSFRQDVFPNSQISVAIPDKVYGLKAEIQVRTLLEHAWADVSHDLTYKSAFSVPDKWQREIARMAALLEDVDDAFERIMDGLRAYAANYGAYLTDQQARDETRKLELVLAKDSDNVELAHRIAKLAMARGDWPKVVEVLTRYVDRAPLFLPAKRDLGVAMCKLNRDAPAGPAYRRGQSLLAEAARGPEPDPDALASLAGTWKGIDDGRARELYRQAFEAAPSDPYPLGNFLEYEIADKGDLSVVGLVRPLLKDAIAACREQADVGMNLPWAFYNIGKFRLLLGQPHESLAAYAKAVHVSGAAFMVDSAADSLERLEPVKDDLPGREWVSRFLLAASAARFAADGPARAVRELASVGSDAVEGPVVIVAGGCDVSVEERTEAYRGMLLAGFEGFRGTVISGGTTAGVARLVGDAAEAMPNAIRAIGYVPRRPRLPEGVTIDNRYSEIRRTDGEDFSPLDPLQSWIDLVACGIDPGEVKLLGIGGGSIAALEYRMALALGAKVAIVEGSGREASRLLQDDDWNTSPNLFRLPTDGLTVSAFLGAGRKPMDPAIRDDVARAIHEEYRRTQEKELHTDNPSMAAWNDLKDALRESNRQQADDIFAKLARVNCQAAEVKDRDVALMTFTDDEVEVMAELEHARWNAERVLDGWTWGPKKDVEKKVSPYLVGWGALPEDVKDWDRSTVRAIPRFLATVGIEVRRRS